MIPVQRLFICQWGPLPRADWMWSSCGVEAVTWIWISLRCLWIVWGPSAIIPASLHGTLLRRNGSCILASGFSLSSPFCILPVSKAPRCVFITATSQSRIPKLWGGCVTSSVIGYCGVETVTWIWISLSCLWIVWGPSAIIPAASDALR